MCHKYIFFSVKLSPIIFWLNSIVILLQLEQKMEQHKLTESALNDKRAELLKSETQLREIEDKYYSSTITIQDKLVQDLRVSISLAQ